MKNKIKNILSLLGIFVFAIGIGIGTYFYIQHNQNEKIGEYSAKMKNDKTQSDSRVGIGTDTLGGVDIPDPSILNDMNKLGELIFDNQNYQLPIIDASYSFNGMFYAAEPQSSLWPDDPIKENVILASHTTFSWYNSKEPYGFGPLHNTQVGDTFTLQYNDHPDRHYKVIDVKEVSPYSIPVSSSSDKPQLLLYTCVKIAYTAEESMHYPRLLVTCEQTNPEVNHSTSIVKINKK